ncbi:hypothetical protein ACFL6C_02910 [Myxococcota bacterium]
MEEPHVSRFETNFLTVCVMLTTGCGGWATGTIVQADGCGDNVCQAEEDCNNCAADCGVCAACGDSTCEPTESCHDCPGDCGICEGCGDTICAPQESCSDCPGDCGDCKRCGDIICDPQEDCRSCPLDCGACDSCSNATGRQEPTRLASDRSMRRRIAWGSPTRSLSLGGFSGGGKS